MIGKSLKSPIGQPRKWILLFWYKLACHIICFFGLFTYLTYEYVNHEKVNWYEEYVGKNKYSNVTARDEIGEAIGPQTNHQDGEAGPFGAE